MSGSRLAADALKTGLPLPWDLCDEAGRLLLRRGFVVESASQLTRLLQAGLYRRSPGNGAGQDSGDDVVAGPDGARMDVVSTDSVIDAMRDAIAETAQDVLAMETSTADAQGMDGGTCACPTLPAAPEYSFAFALMQDNPAIIPRPDMSTAMASAEPRQLSSDYPGGIIHIRGDATFWMSEPPSSTGVTAYAQWAIHCQADVLPDRSLVPGTRTGCSLARYFPGALPAAGSGPSSDIVVTTLTDTQLEFRVPRFTASRLGLSGFDWIVTNVVFRANVPGAHFVTPQTAFRP